MASKAPICSPLAFFSIIAKSKTSYDMATTIYELGVTPFLPGQSQEELEEKEEDIILGADKSDELPQDIWKDRKNKKKAVAIKPIDFGLAAVHITGGEGSKKAWEEYSECSIEDHPHTLILPKGEMILFYAAPYWYKYLNSQEDQIYWRMNQVREGVYIYIEEEIALMPFSKNLKDREIVVQSGNWALFTRRVATEILPPIPYEYGEDPDIILNQAVSARRIREIAALCENPTVGSKTLKKEIEERLEKVSSGRRRWFGEYALRWLISRAKAGEVDVHDAIEILREQWLAIPPSEVLRDVDWINLVARVVYDDFRQEVEYAEKYAQLSLRQ